MKHKSKTKGGKALHVSAIERQIDKETNIHTFTQTLKSQDKGTGRK